MIENQKIYKSGKLRGEKIKYDDRIGYCIWSCWKEADNIDDEVGGPCFDFSDENIKDVKKIINILEKADHSTYTETQEEKQQEEEFEKSYNHPVKKFIREWLDDFTFQFSPFDWRFRASYFTTSINIESGREKTYKLVEGIHVGPFVFTIPRAYLEFISKNED